jgi:hypothetical protein
MAAYAFDSSKQKSIIDNEFLLRGSTVLVFRLP